MAADEAALQKAQAEAEAGRRLEAKLLAEADALRRQTRANKTGSIPAPRTPRGRHPLAVEWDSGGAILHHPGAVVQPLAAVGSGVAADLGSDAIAELVVRMLLEDMSSERQTQAHLDDLATLAQIPSTPELLREPDPTCCGQAVGADVSAAAEGANEADERFAARPLSAASNPTSNAMPPSTQRNAVRRRADCSCASSDLPQQLQGQQAQPSLEQQLVHEQLAQQLAERERAAQQQQTLLQLLARSQDMLESDAEARREVTPQWCTPSGDEPHTLLAHTLFPRSFS